MRTSLATNNDLLLEVSPCSYDEITIFTEGDCWLLAKELHARGIGEVVGITEKENPEYWCHMAVVLPDGNFLDAHGIQTKDQLMTRWTPFCARGKSALAHYDVSAPGRWEELTADQEDCHRLSEDEEVLEVADKLEEWLEDLGLIAA